MKILAISLVILYLVSKGFCENCEIMGEKCVCKKVAFGIEMACTENTFNSKILNLNEIIFPENTTNKKVRIENKIYEGIKSFFENFLLKIKSFAITKNRIIKLEMNSFQMLTNLDTLELNSNSIEIVDKFLSKMYNYRNLRKK